MYVSFSDFLRRLAGKLQIVSRLEEISSGLERCLLDLNTIISRIPKPDDIEGKTQVMKTRLEYKKLSKKAGQLGKNLEGLAMMIKPLTAKGPQAMEPIEGGLIEMIPEYSKYTKSMHSALASLEAYPGSIRREKVTEIENYAAKIQKEVTALNSQILTLKD